jgi:hypothetical protein
VSPSRRNANRTGKTTASFAVVLLVCSNLSRSRDFYRDVLRLHPKSKLLTVRPGSVQLGFTVENVDAFVAGCASRGIPVFEDPYEEPSGRIAVIGDPDGYPIQVGTPAR